ncbi:MAG: CDP-diacylglycerol--glycerol-3-phosphate 3-phosphatidyltransferase [Deltaproteobacteria bacterium]|nr:CDP-diacylglycerol--glycerol-3-phosphate 3-phosphatidyltransferase [Deltaproteobacteria bacterium]
MLFNVPNLITYGRIVLIPLLVVLMSFIDPAGAMAQNKCYGFWAMVVFAIAGISDLVDGYYARKYGAVSTIGKFIDPMADKLIHMATMVMLIPLGRLAAWVVVVLLFREIFVTGIRAVAASEGLVIDAVVWGKRKTAWLNFGLGGLIYYYPAFPGTNFELQIYEASLLCIGIAFVYSVGSAVVYTKRFLQVIRR